MPIIEVPNATRPWSWRRSRLWEDWAVWWLFRELFPTLHRNISSTYQWYRSLIERDILAIAVSKVLMPASYLCHHCLDKLDKRLWQAYAALICLIESTSGKTHACHSGDPYDMQPKIILETLSPELPSRTRESCTQVSSINRRGLTIWHSFLLQVDGHFFRRWRGSISPIEDSVLIYSGEAGESPYPTWCAAFLSFPGGYVALLWWRTKGGAETDEMTRLWIDC